MAKVIGSLTCGLCFLLLVIGCKQSDFDIVPVSGTVTLDGEPLNNARVTFNPRAADGKNRSGSDSYGKTDDQGRYVLETIDRTPGAVVATHRVRIRTRNEEERGGDVIVTQKELLPPKYHAETELEFQVPAGGTDEADFKLESD